MKEIRIKEEKYIFEFEGKTYSIGYSDAEQKLMLGDVLYVERLSGEVRVHYHPQQEFYVLAQPESTTETAKQTIAIVAAILAAAQLPGTKDPAGAVKAAEGITKAAGL